MSVYISKYITKELINLCYKKRYWSSKGLERPTIEYAEFDEETLLFHIDKDKVKDKYEKTTSNSKSIYLKLRS